MIDTLTSLLTDTFGPFGPLLALGGLGVLLIIAALPLLFKKDEDPLNKLRKSQAELEEEHMALRRVETGMGDKLDKYKSFHETEDREEPAPGRLPRQERGSHLSLRTVRSWPRPPLCRSDLFVHNERRRDLDAEDDPDCASAGCRRICRPEVLGHAPC